MSRSFKHLMKLAEAAKVAKVANPETESAQNRGGEGVAAEPGALKFQLVNGSEKNLQTSSTQVFAPVSSDPSVAQSVSAAPPDNPSSPPPIPVESPISASASLDTTLATKRLELEAIDRSEALVGESMGAGVREVKGGHGPGRGAQVGEISPQEESVKGRIYGRPLNPRMRLIEFVGGPRAGQHAQLWVKEDSQIMLNWVVWVKPDVNRPNPPGLHWVMDGSYNWRGVRIK